jgi:hypothetical protein
MNDDETMVRLSASEVACYRWPEDTAEHRALRAAYMDGAASMASAVSAASAEVVQTQDELGALLHAAEAEVERLRDEHSIMPSKPSATSDAGVLVLSLGRTGSK